MSLRSKKSKTMKNESQSHVDHILKCEEHRLWWGSCRRAKRSANKSIKEILQHIFCSVCKKRWELRFHHNNAPAHSTFSIWQFLAERNIIVLEQLPYSPVLVLCDFSSSGSSRGSILKAWRPSRNHNDWATGYFGRILPAVHRSIIEKDGKMH